MSSENKKRGRNDLDGDCGEEPLAKRINNLHLNNNPNANQSQHQQYYQAGTQINGHSSQHLQQHQQQTQPGYHQNTNLYHHNLYQQQEPYDPELTETENPHYFQKNKVLYELHMERERRGRSLQS